MDERWELYEVTAPLYATAGQYQGPVPCLAGDSQRWHNKLHHWRGRLHPERSLWNFRPKDQARRALLHTTATKCVRVSGWRFKLVGPSRPPIIQLTLHCTNRTNATAFGLNSIHFRARRLSQRVTADRMWFKVEDGSRDKLVLELGRDGSRHDLNPGDDALEFERGSAIIREP